MPRKRLRSEVLRQVDSRGYADTLEINFYDQEVKWWGQQSVIRDAHKKWHPHVSMRVPLFLGRHLHNSRSKGKLSTWGGIFDRALLRCLPFLMVRLTDRECQTNNRWLEFGVSLRITRSERGNQLSPHVFLQAGVDDRVALTSR